MFFRQVQSHGDNFSYVIADETAGEAAVVDSSYSAGEIMRVLKTQNFTLNYIINTHGHSDHTAGNSELRSALGGQIVAHHLSNVEHDVAIDDGTVLMVGEVEVKVIYTPGHSTDGICLFVGRQKLLTGDTLFVGECGRTDLPGGNSRSLYESLFGKLLALSDEVEVYPGHDYGKTPSSTIGEERRTNYALQPRSVSEFVDFMRES